MADYQDEIIYGKHPVMDAVEGGRPLDKVWIQIGMKGEYVSRLRELCKERLIPVQMVPKEKLNKLTRGNHQGAVGFLSVVVHHRLEDVLPGIYEKERMPLILVLDGITDVRNFGAIARTAECLGADAIVVGKKNAARINAEAMKTSAGALSKIPVCRESSPMAALEYLKLSGITILSSHLKAEKTLAQVDFTGPVAILLGAEGRGVHYTLNEKADERFVIPQSGTTDSLNVAVATGVILYEAASQRQGR
jgi:23S rRNA (guanosine2251-2'-O)-methyltransferase